MRSAIRLFKGVPVLTGDARDVASEFQSRILEETVPHGFVIAPEILGAYSEREIHDIIEDARDEFGLTGSQMNASFHKSWEKVASASLCQLFVEQILHYITTYGHEALGIYDKDTVFVPGEDLNIPSLTGEIPLVVIKAYTRDELMEKTLTLLRGIALKEETVKDAVNIAVYLDVTKEEISIVGNKEARVMLYDQTGIVPSDPDEFLRYVIYQSTGRTLVIKNRGLISAIKEANGLKIVKYFKEFDKQHGFKPLAAIFNRYKPLFLAFKTNDKLNNYINIISKLSKDHHVPMKPDFLNTITAKLAKGIEISPETLARHLERANFFRKARLAYALNFRKSDPGSILYKVRNGKAYAKEFSFENSALVEPVLDAVLDSIAGHLKGVDKKIIYIPENIVYALPTTEKQFSGNIPGGSYVEIGEDAIIGIHWKNADPSGVSTNDVDFIHGYRSRDHAGRVDIDLSLVNAREKLGWNASWRTMDRSVLFSGDVVDAPGDGASEMYYIKNGSDACYVVSVNLFAGEKGTPFDLFLASEPVTDENAFLTMDEKDGKPGKSYMVDPNHIACKITTTIDDRNRVLGLVIVEDNKTRFFFSESGMGDARVSNKNDATVHALNYLVKFNGNPISLNDLLVRAGARVINNLDALEDGEDVDIDLSLESIDKASLLEIIA